MDLLKAMLQTWGEPERQIYVGKGGGILFRRYSEGERKCQVRVNGLWPRSQCLASCLRKVHAIAHTFYTILLSNPFCCIDIHYMSISVRVPTHWLLQYVYIGMYVYTCLRTA